MRLEIYGLCVPPLAFAIDFDFSREVSSSVVQLGALFLIFFCGDVSTVSVPTIFLVWRIAIFCCYKMEDASTS